MFASIFHKMGSVAGMGMVVGSPFLLVMIGYDPTVKSGSGSVKDLKLAVGMDNAASLNFDLSSINSGGGIQVGKTTEFKEGLKLKIGNYEVKDGDLLCSLEQDGNYFLMKSAGRNKYKVDGFEGNPISCTMRWFGPKNKWPKPKIELAEFKGKGFYGQRTSPSTIYLPSCSFTLQDETGDQAVKRWSISLSNCKHNKWSRIPVLPPIKLVMSYQLGQRT